VFGISFLFVEEKLEMFVDFLIKKIIFELHRYIIHYVGYGVKVPQDEHDS